LKAADWLTQPGGLAERLRGLREAAGLTGDELARRLGWMRTKVLKIENGHQMPSAEDITRWVAACGQPPEIADELLSMLAEGRTIHRQWKHELRRGHASVQENWDRMVRDAQLFRCVELLVIPGWLQTPEYARYRALDAVTNYGAAKEGVDAAVTARMQRQQVIYETSRRFEFVVTEAALRIGAAPAPAMIGQLDRLNVLSQLPNITLGIIPLGVTLPLLPQNGFTILDDRVIVETHASEIVVTATEAEVYTRFADALMAEAVTSDGARRLCTAAVEWWRAQGQPS
jgi:transcriptional regulator with XRE-family HTH domain